MQSETNAAAIKADRGRIAAIMALPEARGREDEARTLAITTDMTVDQVKAKFVAETSASWDRVLASRGLKIGAGAATDASVSPWDAVLRTKGMGA